MPDSENGCRAFPEQKEIFLVAEAAEHTSNHDPSQGNIPEGDIMSRADRRAVNATGTLLSFLPESQKSLDINVINARKVWDDTEKEVQRLSAVVEGAIVGDLKRSSSKVDIDFSSSKASVDDEVGKYEKDANHAY